MFLRKYEQRLAPQLSSELGEPILRCIALNAAGVQDRMDNESFTLLWRPSLVVDGRPHTRLPQTMFLILTPTRLLITDTKRGATGYRPVLGSPILTLARGDAEITAVRDDDGLWLYRLKSLAQSAELDLELSSGRGIAEELATQLREFSVTPRTATAAEQLLGARRRYQTKSYRMAGVWTAVFSLLSFGFGAYQLYGHHVGPPTPKGLFICGAVFAVGAVWLLVPRRG
ncbi:hypothetical protein [Mycobacterium sp. 1245805.9]|uniref:hypothetical protein n=1 Tax=Mycobacterium sp. 1245805.9 TaxID=1856862 RepID=UPI0007FC8EE9|nr:hypothetical protein [Mycobacterium sp. 1245805.9]OBI90607.1 hypothetical protein A9X00_18760 [Mycobacterium sp. 1245805.9]